MSACPMMGPFTVLAYDVKAQVGGKIAQLGARLIDATSKQMADLFFDRFTAEVSGPQEIAAQGPVIAPGIAAASAAGMAEEGTATPMPQQTSLPQINPGLPVRKPAAPAPAISIFSMIPNRIFGLPLVAIIGILLYIPVFILIFKVYVFG